MEHILELRDGQRTIPASIANQSITLKNLIGDLTEELNEPNKIKWDVNSDIIDQVFSTMLGSTETANSNILIETIKLSSYLSYKPQTNLHLQLASLLFPIQVKKSWFGPNYQDKFLLLKDLALADLTQVIQYLSVDELMIRDMLAIIFEGKTREEMFSLLDKDELTFRKKSSSRTIYWTERSDWTWKENKIRCLIGTHLGEPHAWIANMGKEVYYLDPSGHLMKLNDNIVIQPDKTFRKIFNFRRYLLLETTDNVLYTFDNHRWQELYRLEPDQTVHLVTDSIQYNYIILNDNSNNKHLYYATIDGLQLIQTEGFRNFNIVGIVPYPNSIFYLYYLENDHLVKATFNLIEQVYRLTKIKDRISYILSVNSWGIRPVLLGKFNTIVGSKNLETKVPLEEGEIMIKIGHSQGMFIHHVYSIIYVLTDKGQVYWYDGKTWRKTLKDKKIMNIKVAYEITIAETF